MYLQTYTKCALMLVFATCVASVSSCTGQLKIHRGDRSGGGASAKLTSTIAGATKLTAIPVTAAFAGSGILLNASMITVTNGKVSDLAGDGTIFTFNVNPVAEGKVSVSVAAGPTHGASNELSWMFDGTRPQLSFVSISRAALDMSADAKPTLSITATEASQVTLYSDDLCTTAISTTKNLEAAPAQSIDADKLTPVKKITIYGKAVDSAGNESLCTSFTKYTHVLKLVDPNPSASNGFGGTIVELSNGNIVVVATQADINGINDSGAVYLFDGVSGALISTLYGSTISDQIGSSGVTALPNGNFVVKSASWDCQATLGCSGTIADVGAATFVSGTTGISGPVSSTNSLVGSSATDQVSGSGVKVVGVSNYVVASSNWDCQIALGCAANVASVGAVTWGSGTTGVVGAVTATNSLVGSTLNDLVGTGPWGVTVLTNGNYVVGSSNWDCQPGLGCAATQAGAGAVTFGLGASGVTGVVSSLNSLIGPTAGSNTGGSVTALTNGNYVVRSSGWNCQVALGCAGAVTAVGAVTWGDGTSGTVGAVTAANSLIGSTLNDGLGDYIVPLTNGNYVVASNYWDGAFANVGAATFCSGTGATSAVVSAANSLVGSALNDNVGANGVIALTNGNYVVVSHGWDCQIALGCSANTGQVGAVTWGNGTTGISGAVSATNSLIGTTLNDSVGYSGGLGNVAALPNGHYVVPSRDWDCQPALGCPGTAAGSGAVTWGNGVTGTVGVVSTTNSLVGTTAGDGAGDTGVLVLSSGNYVVKTVFWDCSATLGCSGPVTDAGAVTWASGTGGTVGIISASNSIVGSTNSDGSGLTLVGLTNGNYVATFPNWDCTTALGCAVNAAGAGAHVWLSGSAATSGFVSANNSLVGYTAGDGGTSSVAALTNGNYYVRSYNWDCRTALGCAADVIEAGAITWGSGTSGITGVISPANSLVGTTANDSIGSSAPALLTNGNAVYQNAFWGASNEGLVIVVPGNDGPGGAL